MDAGEVPASDVDAAFDLAVDVADRLVEQRDVEDGEGDRGGDQGKPAEPLRPAVELESSFEIRGVTLPRSHSS